MDLVAVLVAHPADVVLDLGDVVPSRKRMESPWADLRLARHLGECWPLLLPKGEEHGLSLAPAPSVNEGVRLRRPASPSRVALLHQGLVRCWAPIAYVARGVLGPVLLLGPELVPVRVPPGPDWFLGVRSPWWTSAEEREGEPLAGTVGCAAPVKTSSTPTPIAEPKRPRVEPSPQVNLFGQWVLKGQPA